MSRDRPTSVDAHTAALADVRDRIRTALPGVVVAYNPATRTAAVQPSRRGAQADGQTFDLPIIPAAPVLWPRFAGIVMVGRLNPGDPVLLVVSDREIDPWMLSGAPYDPVARRRHDLTDALVLPMLSPTTMPITVGDAGASFYLGREDGTVSISMFHDVPGFIEIEGSLPGGIRLGATAVSPALLGTPVVAAFTTWTAAVATAFATWSTAAGPPPYAGNIPAVSGAFIAALGTATATLAATIATWLATKVLVE